MPQKVKLWSIDAEGKLRHVQQSSLDFESRLEEWISPGWVALPAPRKSIVEAFEQIEEWAAFGHTSRVLNLLRSLPEAARREAAGRALVYAAGHDNTADFVNELLQLGADCTVQLDSGSTALMSASRQGNLGLIRRLVEAGADVAVRQPGPRGETAAEMAYTPLVQRYLEKLVDRQIS